MLLNAHLDACPVSEYFNNIALNILRIREGKTLEEMDNKLALKLLNRSITSMTDTMNADQRKRKTAAIGNYLVPDIAALKTVKISAGKFVRHLSTKLTQDGFTVTEDIREILFFLYDKLIELKILSFERGDTIKQWVRDRMADVKAWSLKAKRLDTGAWPNLAFIKEYIEELPNGEAILAMPRDLAFKYLARQE